MAFCCSSVSSSAKHDTGASGAEKSNPYKAANAAVDISNLIPRSKVPAFSTSLFSHSRIPTTRPRDLACNRMPPSPTPDKDYGKIPVVPNKFMYEGGVVFVLYSFMLLLTS